MSNCKIIAMIPARMGSKRVPKKNIRYLLDKPLIKYPIDLAMKNTKVDSVWVNTESDKLGEICSEFGANFHKRPDELANDKATNRDFVYEFLKKHDCDYVVMVNPTSPAITQETFDKFIEYVITNSFDTVLSVVPYKAESYCNDKKINFDGKDKINSQYLDPVEIVVWSITAWKRETFIKLNEKGECPVFGGNVGRFCIPKDESADIDTEEDWNIAEATLLAREKRKTEDIKYLF